VNTALVIHDEISVASLWLDVRRKHLMVCCRRLMIDVDWKKRQQLVSY